MRGLPLEREHEIVFHNTHDLCQGLTFKNKHRLFFRLSAQLMTGHLRELLLGEGFYDELPDTHILHLFR